MLTILLSLFACGVEGDPVAGEAVYADTCAGCHGADGEGTDSAPAIADVTADIAGAERIAEIALNGDGDMAPTDVTEQEAADVGAYVWQQWGE